MYRNRFSVWKKGRDRRKEDGNEREEKERAEGEGREKIAFFTSSPGRVIIVMENRAISLRQVSFLF